MLDFGTDSGAAVMGAGAAEQIFHGVIRGLDEPPKMEVVGTQRGQSANLAQQPHAFR